MFIGVILIIEAALGPADILVFGMLVIEAFTGKKPFGHLARDSLACVCIVKGKRPENSLNDQGFEIRDSGPGSTVLGAGS